MTDKKISIIITKTNNSVSVDSVLNQTYENYEYFVTDNNTSDIKKTINQTTGDYIIFLNADDMLIPNALRNISKMIYLTNADLIKFNKLSNFTNHVPNVDIKKFQYLFQRQDITKYAFADLSEFCIKKDIVKHLDFDLPRHLLTMNILMHAKDITATNHVYISNAKQTFFIYNLSEYTLITDYYLTHKQELPDDIWKIYFETLIPRIVKDTIKNNNKDVFAYCCKRIPTKLIPLKYKLIFFIMKTCI